MSVCIGKLSVCIWKVVSLYLRKLSVCIAVCIGIDLRNIFAETWGRKQGRRGGSRLRRARPKPLALSPPDSLAPAKLRGLPSQLKAQGPSRTCNESKEEEEKDCQVESIASTVRTCPGGGNQGWVEGRSFRVEG